LERPTLKDTLETSTNVAVLLVAVALLSMFSTNYFFKPARPHLRQGLEKGQIFGQVRNVDYRASEQTLLIALNTNCSYCRDNLPFFRKLLAAQHKSDRSLRIVALFPNKADEVAEYVKAHELIIETVPELDFGTLRVSGTPTMILINQSGEVDDFWVGKLQDPEADELVRSLTSHQ
jgi:hypothetical protein